MERNSRIRTATQLFAGSAFGYLRQRRTRLSLTSMILVCGVIVAATTSIALAAANSRMPSLVKNTDYDLTRTQVAPSGANLDAPATTGGAKNGTPTSSASMSVSASAAPIPPSAPARQRSMGSPLAPHIARHTALTAVFAVAQSLTSPPLHRSHHKSPQSPPRQIQRSQHNHAGPRTAPKAPGSITVPRYRAAQIKHKANRNDSRKGIQAA